MVGNPKKTEKRQKFKVCALEIFLDNKGAPDSRQPVPSLSNYQIRREPSRYAPRRQFWRPWLNSWTPKAARHHTNLIAGRDHQGEGAR